MADALPGIVPIHYRYTTDTLPFRYVMHELNAYNPHKAIHSTKNSKAQNFKNDFDVDNPSLNADHQSNK